MKKLTKVIFIIALLAMVVLPLSAKKTMNVSWEWLLSDPDVTAYRYQLNGEAEDGWTVVDGKTSVYTATGLDPYSDYTLYLQCSYDGINWSESASSTAYALLKLEEETPVVETAPQEAVVEEAPVEAEETPVEAVFYIYGFGVSNRWTKSSFESTTLDDGLLTSDDVLGFIQYEARKYPEVVSLVEYKLIDNGFVLTYDEGLFDVAALLPQYRADITEYVTSLLSSFAESLEEAVEEAVEEVVDALVEEDVEETILEEKFSYRGFKADLKLYSTYGIIVLPEGTTEDDVADAASLLVMKYPEASFVTYVFDDGVLTVYYPEITAEYVSSLYPVLKDEAEWYIDQILAMLAEKVEEEAPAEEVVSAPLYSDTLTYKGVTSTITVDNTWATLTMPEGMSSADVEAVASLVAAKYSPEASLVTYSIDGDTVKLTYPEQTDEFLLSVLEVLRVEAMTFIDRLEKLNAPAPLEEVKPVETAPAEEAKPVETAHVEEAKPVKTTPVEEVKPVETTPVVEAKPVETTPVDEVKTPSAPSAVTAVPLKDSPKAEAVKATFNMGLKGGFEWGFGSVTTDGFSKTPTFYPFASLTLEGQNLVHFGAFGLGVRSDFSAVFIPQSKDITSNPDNVWGYDFTLDLKLMSYVNVSFTKFYFGVGVGYSAATNGYTSAHSSSSKIFTGVNGSVGLNTAWALTGVLGVQFNLGNVVTLSAEGYARWFFDNGGKLGTLNTVAAVGLGVSF